MIDQPGKLYLGREVDPAAIPQDEGMSDAQAPYRLSLRDLGNHAVCLGATGAGKTGLGLCVLEEVLLQGIPAIIVDTKGDITNLALQFAARTARDLKPWFSSDQAARQWRAGLAEWGIGPERIQALCDRVTFQIYTPGSDAGLAVNVLQGLNPPPPASGLSWERDAGILRERIAQIVSGLLALAGMESEAMDSREHILLATIFETTWRVGQPIDLAMLIRMVQEPPVTRIGDFDINVFYPRTERFALALALNNLSAAPAFNAWRSGWALDIAALLQPLRNGGSNPAGRTRANIFYLAHLAEAERQFFITLLLSQLVLWMRAQAATSVLRCVLLMDEVAGCCPPLPRHPPTKTPITTVVEQGRASGLGAFLVAQDPADLDYKELANIGTWFVGGLRSERDRCRAFIGLQAAGIQVEREEFIEQLGVLQPRVFLAQSASGSLDAARCFKTRWSMSYLHGPLSLDQVRKTRES